MFTKLQLRTLWRAGRFLRELRRRAIELLQKLVTMPGYTNYGRLKLHPMWNPLRGDPRFEKIVNSFAPKDQSK
jgi:hypothetical protein